MEGVKDGLFGPMELPREVIYDFVIKSKLKATWRNFSMDLQDVFEIKEPCLLITGTVEMVLGKEQWKNSYFWITPYESSNLLWFEGKALLSVPPLFQASFVRMCEQWPSQWLPPSGGMHFLEKPGLPPSPLSFCHQAKAFLTGRFLGTKWGAFGILYLLILEGLFNVLRMSFEIFSVVGFIF